MIGVVLGSALGGLVDLLPVDRSIGFVEAGLPGVTVPGHAGRLIFTRIGTAPAIVALGRVHLYEGRSAGDVTACVRWMAAEGVRSLVLTNAAGSLNPGFAPGEWMMLTDQINLTGTSPLRSGPNFIDMSEAYSPRLRAEFREAALPIGMTLREGIYTSVPGPQYETPAEVRMLRHLGADAIGMSTVLETIQARALGLDVAGFSCLTNWAAGLGTDRLDHHDVIAAGQRAGHQLAQLLVEWASKTGILPVA
jgi:purine-nucleoside phosphorylase